MAKRIITGTGTEPLEHFNQERPENARHVKLIAGKEPELARWIAKRIGVDPYRVLDCTISLKPGSVVGATVFVSLSMHDLRELGQEFPQIAPPPEMLEAAAKPEPHYPRPT